MNLHCPACNQPASVAAPAADGMLHCPRCNLALMRPGGAVLGKLNLRRISSEEIPVVMGTTLVEERDPLEAPLGLPDDEETLAPSARPPTAKPPAHMPQKSVAGPRFQLAIIAEDTALHRQLIVDGLQSTGLASEVVATDQGDRFVTEATRRLARQEPLDLCILDLEMPGLSGYHAAVALRAVERALDAPPTPVLFFSSHVCDETFRRAMETVGSAQYINKASAGGPAAMFERLAQVLRTFQGKPALG